MDSTRNYNADLVNMMNDLQRRKDAVETEIQNEAKDFDEEKAGLALFEIVAICRKAGLDPENCLRTFCAKQVETLES